VSVPVSYSVETRLSVSDCVRPLRWTKNRHRVPLGGTLNSVSKSDRPVDSTPENIGWLRADDSGITSPLELSSLPLNSLVTENADQHLASLPFSWSNLSGCYAILNASKQVQYIEISRDIAVSIKWHMMTVSKEDCAFAQIAAWPRNEGRPRLDVVQATAGHWLSGIVSASGFAPVGNDSRFVDSVWRKRPGDEERKRPQLVFQEGVNDAGKELEGIVKENDYVVFMKGTRDVPLCGFSERLCRCLDEVGIEFESMNALDEERNVGLRKALIELSQWPTLPILFAHGQVVGGCDIVETLHSRGELLSELKQFKELAHQSQNLQ